MTATVSFADNDFRFHLMVPSVAPSQKDYKIRDLLEYSWFINVSGRDNG